MMVRNFPIREDKMMCDLKELTSDYKIRNIKCIDKPVGGLDDNDILCVVEKHRKGKPTKG